jgi:hypothetical protein
MADVDTLYNITIVYPCKILGQLVKGQGHYDLTCDFFSGL